MISTSTPVGKPRSAFAAISVSFIATLTAVLMLGDHTIGIFLAAFAMYACCSLSRPVVAMTNGRDCNAMGDDRYCRIRHGKIDHYVGIRFTYDPQRYANLADARDQPGIFPQQWMIRPTPAQQRLEMRSPSPPTQ